MYSRTSQCVPVEDVLVSLLGNLERPQCSKGMSLFKSSVRKTLHRNFCRTRAKFTSLQIR